MDELELGLPLADGVRQAMRRFATSVVIVTARDGDERFAMAATAATSVSMDPPSMLVCVNRSASIHRIMKSQPYFGLNVLSHSQHDISAVCSDQARREERFNVGDWRTDSETATPYLGDACASLICSREQIHSYGSHGIFIGRVVNVYLGERVAPLVYLDGRYTGIRHLD
jgi:flavin reductase (DIM6/NTAB) family NADH-FMN oxidoreductase RutF